MNITVEKRFLSLILSFVLVLSLVPASVIEVWAADLNTTVLDGKITVKTTDGTNQGTATNNNGMITIGANANTSCGSWSSAGTHQVEITNATTSELTISFDYGVPSNGGTLTIGGVAQSGAGTHTVKLAASGTLTLILKSGNNNKNESTVTLSNFQIVDSSAKTVVVKTGVNGTVKVNGTAITEDVNVTTDAVTGVGVEATAQSGYEFVAWVDADNNVLSSLASYTINPKTDLTVSALFVSKSDASGYWSAGGKLYTDLTTATQNVQSGDVIVLLKDYVLPAGEYTIPAGVTLQIPFNAAHTLCDAKPEILEDKNPYPALKAYRTLTMASGAKLIVNGTIEVSAKHIASHGGKFVGGRPYEYYGKIVMNESSEIQLNSGGTLYAWGYIIGSGKVTALPGSAVYEKMQVTDYLGGTGAGLVASKKIFPFSQYYVQNVEVEEVIHSGASLVVHAGVYASGINEAVLAFIGSGGSEAMFALSSGTATKYYDNATDRIILDVNGTVSLNPITFPFGGINYNSSDYVLPIGNNYTINVNSGSVTITQNIMLQPGTNINIAQGATVDVQSSVYVMDADNWGNYCFGVPMRPLLYVPTSGKAPVARSLQDAKIDVNGTIIVSGSGAVYTSAANAQIISMGETGSIQFERQAPSGTSVYRTTYAGGTYNPDKPEIPMSAAVLTNGNGSTESTASATAGTTYEYCGTHERWYTGDCGCCDGTHSEATTEKITANATCTTAGVKHITVTCTLCGTTLDEYDESITATGHTEVIDAAVAPTCTTAGKTEGKHCSVCNEVLVAQTEVAALGHTEVIDAAVAATCTTAGKTEGKHCSVCNEVLVAQEEIQAIAHKNKEHHAKADATCVSTGTIEYWSCPDCKTNFSDEACTTAVTNLVIAKDSANHVNKTDHVEKSATCLEDGYTAGVFCEDCKTWISGHGVISAKGHTEEIIPAVEPTCTETGLTEGKKCSVCGTIITAQQTIAAKGHTEVIDAAKAPTCTETGLTEGKHCSVCDAVIVEQTEIDALGHIFGNITVAKAATCIATGNDAYKLCSRCELYFAGDAAATATDGKADTSTFVTEIDPDNHMRTSEHGETHATCLTAGYTAGTHCDDCNQWISGHEEIPAIGHEKKVHHAKVDATCVKTGTIEYWSCPDCDKNFSDEACTTAVTDLTIAIDPDNHELKTTDAKAPTCTEIGWDAYVTCQRGCGHTTYVEKPATGHNMQETAAAVAPTCTEPGKTAILSCANGCGKTEGGAEIPATGHSGGEATCQKPKECTVCGESYGDKNPSNHVSSEFTYENNGATHAKYYACCKALAQESEAHNHVKGECVCGNTLSYTVYWNVNGAVAETDERLSYGTTPAFGGETPAKANDAEYHYSFAGWAASANGEVMATLPAVTKTVTYYAVFTAQAHTDASADGNHNCDDCGRTNVSVHTNSDATCTAPATCTDCFVTTGEALGHTDENPKDHKCDRGCGEVNMGTHEEASGRHTCDYCSQAVTHCKNFLTPTPEVPADCTTAGNHAYYTCSVCGKYYSDADAAQEIAKNSWITSATGHAFEGLGTVCTNSCGYTRAAKIDATSYETLDAALAAAQTGDTIVALTKIVIEGDVTWNLTGKKLDIQYLDLNNYALVVKGKLTIKGGEFNFANMYGIGVMQTGTLVIDGGKFTTSEDEYLIGSWGTTTIYGGTYSTDISEYLAPEYKVSQNAGRYVVEKCYHTTVTKVIDPAPTCTEDGLATYTCVDCQHMYTKALPATGHKDNNNDNICDVETCGAALCTESNHIYETIPEKAATCKATGLTAYQMCTACGHIPVQPTELPIVAHQGTWNEQIPATCENPGRLGYFQCTMCGGNFDSNQKALTSLVIPATGHDYVGEITQDPTCTAPGIKTFTCQNDASHTYTEAVDATGHQYGTWIEEIAATCEEEGTLGHYSCSVCGGNFDNNKLPLDSLMIPAKQHDYVGEITKDPTCTEDGVKTFTCRHDRSHTYTEAVDAVGHQYGEWIAEDPATCTEDGTLGHYHCTACGVYFDAEQNILVSIVIPKAGHTPVIDPAVAPTCTEPGKTEGEHCSVCPAVLTPQVDIPALGHKDENKDHVCDNGCTVPQGTHADSAEDDDHVCDYGCQAVLEDCSDVTTDKDHDCDVCGKVNVTDHDYKVVVTDPTCETDGYTTYTCNCTHTYTGDVVSALGHKDVNKDHVCDNGCGVYQGKHEDTDKNHNCDHGCAETIGTCEDSDHDHDCDYGCDQYYGVHEDKNQDHKCDYGCTVTIGTCEDTDKDHYCDYGCGKYYGTHADSNGAEDPDHNCDYCDQKIEDCYDNDTNHICDECGTELSECSDSDDPDHNCDYCGKKIEDCYDTDPKDHKCDECGATLSQCADSDDNDHNCDYCGKEDIEGHTPGAAATCETDQICTECKAVLQAALGHRDDDKNHACDNGCDVKQGDHKDDNKDHRCDYGCAESIGTCEDADHDHYCDYGCTKYYGTHEDTDKDHKCDYGCTVTIGTCEDTDKDHACDYGCSESIGTHADSATDNDHLCDYGCGEIMEACSDMTGDGDHICDYCGSSEVLTQCTGGTPVRENENPATVAEAGSYDSVVYCSECNAELSRDTIAIPQLLSQVETEEFTDSTIPETIKTNPNYNTVEKLADAMSNAVIAEVITESIRDNDLVSVKDVQTQLMDVTLQYSTDGETWHKADEEHFPDDGKIEIILPVPEGTKHSRYTYYVAHMFTSGAFGNTAGEMEYPEVDEIVVDGQECIRFYVTGLSPITVSYLETEPCGDGHTHASYGFDETNHWSICSICGETFAATPHTFENDACGCGAKRVKVVAMGQIQYTVSGQTVTVTHDTACRVGYLVNGKYKALPAIKVSENCYRFIAPADVEEVLLVAVADLDQDGDVDADDMDILSNGLKPKAHASYKPLDAWQQFAADVNNNGKLNAADLLLVARSQTGHEMYKALTW